MARILFSNFKEPFKLSPQSKSVWICQCGLSKNKPFCDGSHTRTLEEEFGETYFYTPLTQKRLNMPHLSRSEVESHRQRSDEILYRVGSTLIKRIQHRSKEYKDVCEIRSFHGDASTNDIIDTWSDIYILQKNDEICATMRVTQARDGYLDLEDFYPEFLRNSQLRPSIGSANRLYKSDKFSCTKEDVFLFIVEVWKDQYNDGMRLDLINATIPMTRYYRNLGYQSVGQEFIHPRTKRESYAMVYIANINNRCILTDAMSDHYKSWNSNIEEYEFISSLI